MLINKVPADFLIDNFKIINYHQFFCIMKNKYVGDNKIHKNGKEIDSGSVKDDVWESDLRDFFEPYKDKIEKYKSILGSAELNASSNQHFCL